MTDKNKIVLVFIILIAALALSLLLVRKTPNRQAQPPRARSAFETAPKGALIQGFPKELILDPRAKLLSSYAYPKQKQYTAIFTSSKSVKDQYQTYVNYLNKQQYKFINKSLKTNGAVIYVTSPKQDLSIQISSQNNTTITTVGYLARK